MKNNVTIKFSILRKRNEKALIAYLVGGYPDLETSKQIIETVIESGADIIEVGIPFSDPMADGPVIQEAFSESLKKWNSTSRLPATHTVDKNAAYGYSYSCNDLF